MRIHISISNEPSSYEEVQRFLRSDETGAIALFEGVVRNDALKEGGIVQHLFYEAHIPMVHAETQRLLEELQTHFPIQAIYFHHLIGKVAVGSTSIWLGIAAKHRLEAFEAQTWFLNQFKKCIPIWKKEMGTSSENWVI
jgi:molybdopterin synthase catalytic subunit